jgi:sigma-B regulation protein RsbU (phosphoserine phosphatase)
VGFEGTSAPSVNVLADGTVVPVPSDRFLEAVDGVDGCWYEIAESERDPAELALQVGPIIASLLSRETATLRMAKALASRFEEVELIYTITETLGRTIQLNEAAQKIVEAVSEVVGAGRASILVYDPKSDELRAVAGVGRDVSAFPPIPVADPYSIAAKVFRDRVPISFDPEHANLDAPTGNEEREYRGAAFLSVPIVYTGQDGDQRTVGVINLTDRAGKDVFGLQETRLVTAIASQIGVAIQNAHLVTQDLERQRLRHELQLAHDLQLKLLPSPATLGPGVDTAAHCQPAESVGGDFYNYLKLPEGRVGVMLGDVSSHGFSSALIMALVLSAAGIHAEEAETPDDALRDLLASVKNELADTEMHIALFYGVADPAAGILRYANAGHPHAFVVAKDGSLERLGATCPPLGLTDGKGIVARSVSWRPGEDLLVLFSDGNSDAVDESGNTFGESRVMDIVGQFRNESAEKIVDAVVKGVNEFSEHANDDRTILVLRA